MFLGKGNYILATVERKAHSGCQNFFILLLSHESFWMFIKWMKSELDSFAQMYWTLAAFGIVSSFTSQRTTSCLGIIIQSCQTLIPVPAVLQHSAQQKLIFQSSTSCPFLSLTAHFSQDRRCWLLSYLVEFDLDNLA